MFVSLLLEITVFVVFDPVSAVNGIFWMRAVHCLNQALLVPAFALFFFHRRFLVDESPMRLFVPAVSLMIPYWVLSELQLMFSGLLVIWR